jgi:L-rhamnose-H+ transport protein
MNLGIGVFLAILAAVINGNFALPLKRARKWSWENSWGVYSLVAFFILPFAMAFFTTPD